GAVATIALAAFVAIGLPSWFGVQSRLAPDPSWQAWSERRVALWLADHLRPGERAFLSGDHAFWLNVFANVPQVRGGQDFSAVDPWPAHAAYQINTGPDVAISKLWLEALSVRYLVVTTPSSSDVFHDFTNPAKFDGTFPVVFDERGVRIYEVPLVGDPRAVVAASVELRSSSTTACISTSSPGSASPRSPASSSSCGGCAPIDGGHESPEAARSRRRGGRRRDRGRRRCLARCMDRLPEGHGRAVAPHAPQVRRGLVPLRELAVPVGRGHADVRDVSRVAVPHQHHSGPALRRGDHADLPGLARDGVLPSRALRVPRARDALSTRGFPGRDRRRDFYGRVDLDRPRRRLRTDRRVRLRRVGLVRARTLARERLAWVARRGGRAPRRDRRVPRVHGSRVRGGRRPAHAPEAVRARAHRWPGASHRRTRVAARSRFRRGQLLRRLPRRTGALAHRGPVGA